MPSASDIREMTDSEIFDAVNLAKSELFNLRFQRANGQLTNPLRIRAVRRDIARYKTILRQRQLAREIVEQEES